MEEYAAVCYDCEYVGNASFAEAAQELRRRHWDEHPGHTVRLQVVVMSGDGEHGRIEDVIAG